MPPLKTSSTKTGAIAPPLAIPDEQSMLQRIWNAIIRALRCLCCCCCAAPTERETPSTVQPYFTHPISPMFQALYSANLLLITNLTRIEREPLEEIEKQIVALPLEDLKNLCNEALAHHRDTHPVTNLINFCFFSNNSTEMRRLTVNGCLTIIFSAIVTKATASFLDNSETFIVDAKRVGFFENPENTLFCHVGTTIIHHLQNLCSRYPNKSGITHLLLMDFYTDQMHDLRQTLFDDNYYPTRLLRSFYPDRS